MVYESFSAVQLLDDNSLREVLKRGVAEQRIWAAWSLALRAGVTVPHLVQHVSGEPSTGVRRALLVVLAGHGEVDTLVAHASHDPSLDVRAHALGLVTRFVAQGVIPPTLVTQTYAAGPSQLRCAILEAIPRDATKDLRNLVEQALSDGTVEEQVEAFDAAVRIPASDDVARRWLARTPADVAALALLRLRNHDAAQVITLLASATTVVKRAAVAALTWLPIAAIAVIAQGDFCSFAALRDRSDFRHCTDGCSRQRNHPRLWESVCGFSQFCPR